MQRLICGNFSRKTLITDTDSRLDSNLIPITDTDFGIKQANSVILSATMVICSREPQRKDQTRVAWRVHAFLPQSRVGSTNMPRYRPKFGHQISWRVLSAELPIVAGIHCFSFLFPCSMSCEERPKLGKTEELREKSVDRKWSSFAAIARAGSATC